MRPEHLMDIVKGFIENGNHEIGFRYITTGDGILIPEYPACLIIYDGTARDIHGTHYFRTGFVLQIVVLHANLEAGREDRTREDLELSIASSISCPTRGSRTDNVASLEKSSF